LVGIGIEIMAASDARQIAPDLSAAGAAEARGLIGELLDEHDHAERWARAIEGERVMLIESTRPVTEKLVVGPYFERQMAAMLRRSIALADAARQPTYPAAKGSRGPAPVNPGVIEAIFQPSQDRFLLTHYRCLAKRRAAALVLALRLYQLDHAGALPARLAELAPTYLPAVPLDPLAADARPLGYSGAAAADPYVYSVADNGTDEGASTQPSLVLDGLHPQRMIRPRERPDEPYEPWERDDAVFYLRRRPKPAVQAEDEGPAKPFAGAATTRSAATQRAG
jgi:hypothetical protein